MCATTIILCQYTDVPSGSWPMSVLSLTPPCPVLAAGFAVSRSPQSVTCVVATLATLFNKWAPRFVCRPQTLILRRPSLSLLLCVPALVRPSVLLTASYAPSSYVVLSCPFPFHSLLSSCGCPVSSPICLRVLVWTGNHVCSDAAADNIFTSTSFPGAAPICF